MGKFRNRFGGMGRFKGGLRCKRWVNSVIINVTTEMNLCSARSDWSREKVKISLQNILQCLH